MSCILSYYSDIVDDFNLPPLLESVMIFPVIRKDEANEEYNSYMFEFQLSSWMPIGNLRNVYQYAPAVGTYFCFPFKQNLGFDIGVQGGFPIKSSFDYYEENSPVTAKATYFIGLNARGRYRGAFSNNVVYFYYLGMGVNWLSTDVVSGYNEENDTYYYHRVTAMDIFGGFIEYHFTPYGSSSKVRYNVGNSSINVGISFTIPYYY